jgi:hypothetical protein
MSMESTAEAVQSTSSRERQASRIQSLLNIIQAWLPVLTVVGGALWALYTYLDHQSEVQREAARQANKEAITRRLEAQKPFLEKQLALYFEAAQIAGKLVTLKPGNEKWDEVENRFWQLYWSELSMVESPAVEAAMVKVGDALSDYKQTPDNERTTSALDDAVYELAHAIRDGITATWTGRAD